MNRLMVINVHYAPQSFGGATVVAEQLTGHLSRAHDWRVMVVTTHTDPTIPAYTLRRYSTTDCDVVSINLPVFLSYELTWRNPEVDTILEQLLVRFEPDLVHCHAIQNLGAGYFPAIRSRDIPLVVTAHDNWWLCDRQFMIDSFGRYCHQTRVDPDRCRYCVDLPNSFEQRSNYLRDRLGEANLVLAPSKFQRDLYRANGYPHETCKVNENGIVKPQRPRRREERGRVQLGFIGGPGKIKGAEVITTALQKLGRREDYQLLVVDAAQNVGGSWNNHGEWDVPGALKFVPAYSQATIDEFFDQVDVLLFPSQWRESFGLTVREALARDVWVIGTGEGGIGEAIVDGENGHRLPLTADPSFLCAAIEACLETPERWQNYVNPRKHEIRWFEDQARELDSMYREVMGVD